MSKRETKAKIKNGIQNQLTGLVLTEAELTQVKNEKIDREIEALKQILMAVESLSSDEKNRVFCYLKKRYSSSWPLDNY